MHLSKITQHWFCNKWIILSFFHLRFEDISLGEKITWRHDKSWNCFKLAVKIIPACLSNHGEEFKLPLKKLNSAQEVELEQDFKKCWLHRSDIKSKEKRNWRNWKIGGWPTNLCLFVINTGGALVVISLKGIHSTPSTVTHPIPAL